jgi:hypothetical protein
MKTLAEAVGAILGFTAAIFLLCGALVAAVVLPVAPILVVMGVAYWLWWA